MENLNCGIFLETTKVKFEPKCLIPNLYCYSLSLSSVGKESTCSAGDSGSIPGSGRSAGGRIDYPPLYSWVSLVAQLVKSSCNAGGLAWKIPWTV